jgi:hypothetical protein
LAAALAAALAAVPDPRRPRGWRPEYEPVPLVALLQATVAAVLCGARGQAPVAQWIGERLDDEPELLEALGFPAGRGACVATLHRVYRALDVDAFETALGDWLARMGIAADDPLALDGKTLRGAGGHVEAGEYVPGVHLVAAYAHQAQAVLAQLRTSGRGQELAAAQAVLAQVPLAGRVVTADALLTQREVCAQMRRSSRPRATTCCRSRRTNRRSWTPWSGREPIQWMGSPPRPVAAARPRRRR